MTKDNKTSTARETVYDRCAYVGCYNGKFINGRRLFHFPAETDRRLEMWIERSGNFRLRTWAATSLRKAGLCGDHFDEKCFTNATRKALRRNVVPRHYTEDSNYRKANIEGSEHNENTKDNTGSEEDDDPMNCDRLSPFGESAVEEKHCSNEIHEESSLQSGEFVLGDPIETSVDNRTPSPVVEFIVEELDENLVSDRSEAHLVKSIFEEEEDDQDVPGNAVYETSPMSMKETDENKAPIESGAGIPGLRVNRSASDVRTYYRLKNHPPVSADEMTRVKLEMASEESEPVTDEENNTAMVRARRASRCSNTECGNRHHERMLMNLRQENKMLRKSMRLLKQNLRRSKAREANYMRVRDMLKNTDEFLNIQECNSRVARAMVKLALHKNRSPYTKEERDFATQLYRHASAAFLQLRRAGCNFPGKNTMKRWIAEDDGQPSTCNFIIADGTDHVAEQDAGDEMDDADDDMVEVGDGIDEPIDVMDHAVRGINEPVDNMDHAVEDAQVAIDDLVDHLEEVIDDAEGQEEYVRVFPPGDEDEEDDFK